MQLPRVVEAEGRQPLVDPAGSLGIDDARVLVDPERPGRVYEWLPAISFDDKGNCIVYEYKPRTRRASQQRRQRRTAGAGLRRPSAVI